MQVNFNFFKYNTLSYPKMQDKPSFKAELSQLKKTKLDVDRYQKTMKIDPVDINFAEFVTGTLPKKRSTLLDIGSNNGALARELRRRNPNLKTINLDVSSEMNKKAQKFDEEFGLTRNTKYIVGNAFKIPVTDGSIDTITCNRVLHEIYSYEAKEYNEKKFSRDSVKHFFEEAHKKLTPYGAIAITDCARPDNADEICTIININHTKNLTDEEIMDADVCGLDTYNLLKRFCMEFEPAKGNYVFEGENCKMPKWLVAEFIRHRKFNDTPWHWADEINEQYCALSWDDYRNIANETGFVTCSVSRIARGEEFNFYHVNENEFSVSDSTGEELITDMEFPLHFSMSFIKAMDKDK